MGVVALGFTALTRVGSGTVNFLKNSTRAAAEETAEIGRLNQTIRNAIPGWDGNTAAIERQIKASQRLAFSDDQVRNSLGFLVGKTKDMTKAQDLLTIAQDLSRAKKIDLMAATKAVTKADDDSIMMLQRLGIAVDKNMTAEQNLAAIRAATAGQAETYARSQLGALERIRNAGADAMEDFGGVILPGVNQALNMFADFVTGDVVQGALGGFIGFIETRLTPAMGRVETLFSTVGKGALFLRDRFVEARAVVSPFTDNLTDLASIANNQLLPALQKAFSGDILGAIEQFKFGAGGIKNIFSDITLDAGELRNRITVALTNAATKARDQLPKVQVAVSNLYEFAVTLGSDFVTSSKANIQSGLTSVMAELKRETFPSFAAEFNSAVPTALNAAMAGNGVAANGGGGGWLDTLKFTAMLFPPARLAGLGVSVANEVAPDFVGEFFATVQQAFTDPTGAAGKVGGFIAGLTANIVKAGTWLVTDGVPMLARFAGSLAKGLWDWATDPTTWIIAQKALSTHLTALVAWVKLWWNENKPEISLNPLDWFKSGGTTEGAKPDIEVNPDQWNIHINDNWSFFNNVMLPSLQKDIPTWGDKIGTEVKKHWDTMWGNIFKGLVVAKESDTSNMSQSFVDTIIAAINNVPKSIEEIKATFVAMLGSLFAGLAGGANEVKVKFDLAGLLLKAIAWEKFNEIGDAVVTNILGGMLTDGGKTGDRATAVERFFEILYLDFEDAAITWGGKIANIILTGVRDALKQLPFIDDALLDSMFPKEIKLPESAKSKLSGLGVEMPQIVAYAVSRDMTLSEAIALFAERAKRKADQTLGTGAADEWKRKGAVVPTSIAGGVTAQSKTLNSAVAGVSLGALAEGKRGFSGGTWRALGENAGAGLVAGMRAMIGQAASAGASLARAAINAVADTLETKSPSKVMHKFGVWSAEGLVIGAISKLPWVKAEMSRFAGESVDAFFSPIETQAPKRSVDVWETVLNTTKGNGNIHSAANMMGNVIAEQVGVGMQDFVRAKFKVIALSLTGELAEGVADEAKKASTWSGLLDAIDGSMDGVIQGGAESMKRLGHEWWDMAMTEFAYSAEKGWHTVIEAGLDAAIAQAVPRTAEAKTRELFKKYADVEMTDLSTDPAIVGPLLDLGKQLWEKTEQAYMYNAALGVYEIASGVVDLIAQAVARTSTAKLKETMARYAGEAVEQFTFDQSLIDKVNNSAGVKAAQEATQKQLQADAAKMISPLTSLAGAKMPTTAEIDAFFVVYEHWLGEWNKRADTFAQTATATSIENVQKMSGVGEMMSKLFSPIIDAAKVQAVDPGQIEGAMSNVWNLLNQFNQVMKGGTDGEAFQGDWMEKARTFALNIGTIFTYVRDSFAVVGEAEKAAVSGAGIAGMFSAMKSGVNDLLTGSWTDMKADLDPANTIGLASMFLDMWDYDNRPGTSLAKKHNSSIHAMGGGVNLLVDQAAKWRTWSANVVSYIDSVIGALNRLNTAMGTPGTPAGSSPPPGSPPPPGNAPPPPYIPPPPPGYIPDSVPPVVEITINSEMDMHRFEVAQRTHKSIRAATVKVGAKA